MNNIKEECKMTGPFREGDCMNNIEEECKMTGPIWDGRMYE